jgi:5-methylthioadenosine/S-adenosylhomocysteine deaminase
VGETTLITNGLVVTMDGSRRIIRDGAVAIEDSRIVEVGKTQDLLGKYRKDRSIDATGCLVTPGLINGHLHTSFYITRGLFDDGGLFSDAGPSWFYGFSFPFEGAFTREDAHTGALGIMAEMIKLGTTSFADPGAYHEHMGAVAQASKDIGMRAGIARPCRDTRDDKHPVPDNMLETTQGTLAKCEALIKEWNGAADDLIRIWVGMRFVHFATDELMIKAKALADRYHVGMQGHAAWSWNANKETQELTGYRDIERYERLGVLDKNVLLVHMGHVTDEEIDLLKARDAKVCHCPSASTHGSYGNISTGKMMEMVKRGVTVGLGVDSVNESDHADMIREAYLTAMGHKEVFPGQTVIGAHKTMEMLTRDGARALLWEDQIGTLEIGKRADIAIFDMRSPEWHPTVDPISSLIYASNGSSTNTVLINGKVVMEDKRLLTVDEAGLMEKVDVLAKSMQDRLGIQAKPKWPIV